MSRERIRRLETIGPDFGLKIFGCVISATDSYKKPGKIFCYEWALFPRGRSHILFYTVCVENDTTDLAVDLWDKRPKFTDVVFVVGDREFHAHKMVLASESEYFKSLLYGKMKEATLKKIRLSKDNVTPDAFEKILQFVYKKSLDITEPLEVY